jgi:hypothetical protein
LLEEIEQLSPEKQGQALEFIRNLQNQLPAGTSGDAMIALVHELDFDPKDLTLMHAAIKEGCEKIDWNDWA